MAKKKKKAAKQPRIRIDAHEWGELDEIVVHRPSCFHIERMSDSSIWMAIYIPGHNRIDINLWTGGKKGKPGGKIYAGAEGGQPLRSPRDDK